jgi:hypothetical protein
VTDPLLVAAPLYGLRRWTVVVDGEVERLASPQQKTIWSAHGEWTYAACPRGHEAPVAGCDCGVHAWHPSRWSAREVLAARAGVAGVVEAQGPVEVHEDGFRAERARPYALVQTPGRNPHLIRRLAASYDVPIAEVHGPDELLAWCRERELGLDPAVVAELLDTGDPAERRRARRRKTRVDALRVALAVIVAGLLVVLGLQVAGDPPSDRTLFGRAGEVHTPPR